MSSKKIKKILAATLLGLWTSGTVWAQTNGSNSTYSRFGLGTLNDYGQGYSRGMGGVGIGLRTGNRVNMANPASFSAIDSLSFLFDVGMNVSMGNMKSGGNSLNVTNASLSHVTAGLRLYRGLGLSFGFVPFSTIGYNFSTTKVFATDESSSKTITSQTTFYGNGGLHQLYLGMGWNPFAKLSIGANVSYIWGSYNHSTAQQFLEGNVISSEYSSMNTEYDAPLKTYKIDLGAQYPVKVSPKDWVTIGATAQLGHQIGTDATVNRYTTKGDTISGTARHPFDIPYTFGVGLGWQRENRLLVGADFKYEKWGDCKVPKLEMNDGQLIYTGQKGSYEDRIVVSAGAQYTPAPLAHGFMKRVQYRAGGRYSSPYLKINGQEGPKEYGLSAGVGLPINNRSVVNVNLQWLRRVPSVKSMITENYFMINLGITFNEMWFMKWKIQ